MRDGWLMVTVALLDLVRRRLAGTRLLLAVTRVRLAVPQSRSTWSAVPHNSRSVCKHGMMIGTAESVFGMHENVFSAHRLLHCLRSKLFR
jgi:hypothetical protein